MNMSDLDVANIDKFKPWQVIEIFKPPFIDQRKMQVWDERNTPWSWDDEYDILTLYNEKKYGKPVSAVSIESRHSMSYGKHLHHSVIEDCSLLVIVVSFSGYKTDRSHVILDNKNRRWK